MENFNLKKYLSEGRIHLSENNTLEKLADITFETAEGNKGNTSVFIEDFEGNESLFNKAYDIISQGTTSFSSGKFDYKFSTHKDNEGDKFIKLSFKLNNK
jgi:hypothetical protein